MYYIILRSGGYVTSSGKNRKDAAASFRDFHGDRIAFRVSANDSSVKELQRVYVPIVRD